MKQILFYRRGNELILQDGWKWAESYTFSADDYETAPESTRSTTEWIGLGYTQIDREEAEEMFTDAGFAEAPC